MTNWCKFTYKLEGFVKAARAWNVKDSVQESYDLIQHFTGGIIRGIAAILLILSIGNFADFPLTATLHSFTVNPTVAFWFTLVMGILFIALLFVTVVLESDPNKNREVILTIAVFAAGMWLCSVFQASMFSYMTGFLAGGIFADMNKKQVAEWRKKRRDKNARKALAKTAPTASRGGMAVTTS